QGELEPVQLVRAKDLAGEARIALHVTDAVEHVFFFVAWGADGIHPLAVNVAMAGGAAKRATAFGLDVQAPVSNDLHHTPALEPFELVYVTGLVCHCDLHGALLNSAKGITGCCLACKINGPPSPPGLSRWSRLQRDGLPG